MSTNRYIDKLKARLAKESDQRMQLQALMDDQAARNRALLAERDALRDALEQAAQSLESIGKLAGRDEFMQDVLDIRGFANSRATVARAALQGEQP